MKLITAAWIEAARDDLTLIQEIIHNATLTHLVAFHLQQTIEKSFKAILDALVWYFQADRRLGLPV